MNILGINCGHDSGCAILKDGEISAVVQEERASRVKHMGGFPTQALESVLSVSNIKPEEISHVAISGRDRRIESIRELHRCLSGEKLYASGGVIKRLKTVIADNTFNRAKLNRGLFEFKHAPKHYIEHHQAHASSAYRNSGFKASLIVTLDGVGDGLSGTISIGKAGSIERFASIPASTSIGLMYQATTEGLGFIPVEGEYKTMGLASYGNPKPLFNFFFEFSESDWIVDFKYPAPHIRQSDQIKKLLRDFKPEDIASSCQAVAEELVLSIINVAKREVGMENLCYSGGVALNVKINKRIREECGFKSIYIHPDSGDSGLALGAAQEVYFNLTRKFKPSKLSHVYYGNEASVVS